jgi:hypothetical protein
MAASLDLMAPMHNQMVGKLDSAVWAVDLTVNKLDASTSA